jgi:hypothetical protein
MRSRIFLLVLVSAAVVGVTKPASPQSPYSYPLRLRTSLEHPLDLNLGTARRAGRSRKKAPARGRQVTVARRYQQLDLVTVFDPAGDSLRARFAVIFARDG